MRQLIYRLCLLWQDERGAVASSWYGLTYEKYFSGAHTENMESTNVSVLMTTDTYAPNSDTHAVRSDVTNEVTGAGYTTGGQALGATPSWTVASPLAGQMAYDSPNPAWPASTITSAESAVLFQSTGVAAADELYLRSDFGTPVSTTNGTLTVTVDTNGWTYLDYLP